MTRWLKHWLICCWPVEPQRPYCLCPRIPSYTMMPELQARVNPTPDPSETKMKGALRNWRRVCGMLVAIAAQAGAGSSSSGAGYTTPASSSRNTAVVHVQRMIAEQLVETHTGGSQYSRSTTLYFRAYVDHSLVKNTETGIMQKVFTDQLGNTNSRRTAAR